MKYLVAVGEFAHIDPNAVDAIVVAGGQTVVCLRSGETVEIPDVTPDEVLTAFEEAMHAAREVQQ